MYFFHAGLPMQRPRFGLRLVHLQYVAYRHTDTTVPGSSPSSMVFPWTVIIPVVLVLVCHEGLVQQTVVWITV